MLIDENLYLTGLHCEKKLWLTVNRPQEAQSEFRGEEPDDIRQLKTLASAWFHDRVHANVRFCWDGCVCYADYTRSTQDGLEVYLVTASTMVKDWHLQQLAYQRTVIEGSGEVVGRLYVLRINENYVRRGSVDVQELLRCEDCTKAAASAGGEAEKRIARIKELLAKQEAPDASPFRGCLKPEMCLFLDPCHRLAPDSVFGVHGLSPEERLHLYAQGVETIPELYACKPKIPAKSWMQVRAQAENGGPYINRAAIQKFLQTLWYPMYFLDFETYQPAVPACDDTTPYTQIPFEYSLHSLQREDAALEHTAFLAENGEDPRRALALRLCEDIPEGACTLAYNMVFEKSVIRKLAKLFDDLAPRLMDIHDHMRDLLVPFQKLYYYCREMKGSCSIKSVLPALCPGDPELDYAALHGIHDGVDAMNAFPRMLAAEQKEADGIRRDLLAYCRLDTLAMVRILEKLRAV